MVPARQWVRPLPCSLLQGLRFRAVQGPGWADTFSAGQGVLMSRIHHSLLFLALVSKVPFAETLILLSQQFSASTTVPVSLFSKMVTLHITGLPSHPLWIKASITIRKGLKRQVFGLRAAKGKSFSIFCLLSICCIVCVQAPILVLRP